MGAPSCLPTAWDVGASLLPHHSAPTPTKHNTGPSQRVPRAFVFPFEFLGFFFFFGGGGGNKKALPSELRWKLFAISHCGFCALGGPPLTLRGQHGQPARQELPPPPRIPCPPQWPTGSFQSSASPVSITLHPLGAVVGAPVLTAPFGPAGRAR